MSGKGNQRLIFFLSWADARRITHGPVARALAPTMALPPTAASRRSRRRESRVATDGIAKASSRVVIDLPLFSYCRAVCHHDRPQPNPTQPGLAGSPPGARTPSVAPTTSFRVVGDDGACSALQARQHHAPDED